ncbi:acid-sensing ion channel 3-like [Ischnura elegans]|uniref:acid-sensing ion channel 3-like n=1 Tax=Ischnura elegans TaxID=197161 RepID=UPI001ED8BFB9|nr:acid-sensing ion channel 3-like [Ischnura elegans]
MILAAGGAVSVSLSTWSRFADSPTVISVERDHWVWRTPVPAATICPRPPPPDPTEILEVAKWVQSRHDEKESGTVPADKEEALVLAFLEAFRTATLGSLTNLRPFANSQDLLPPASDLKDLFIKLQPKFKFKSSISGLSTSQEEPPPWHAVLNEAGLCYVVFSGLDQMQAARAAERDSRHPLTVAAGNPLDGDVNIQLVQISHGYKMYFHSPWDQADVFSRPLASTVGHYVSVDLAAAAIITTDEARTGLGVAQRKCRFQDEPGSESSSPLPHGELHYSFNSCRSQCRASLARKLCGCHAEHLFGGRLQPVTASSDSSRKYAGDATPCDIAGLICLSQHEDLLIKLPASHHSLENSCECLSPCEDVTYVAARTEIIQWPLGNTVRWGISKYPRTRHKRDVLFGFSDLLGSMGGAAGLFLGCSLLSAVELVYFVTLRAFWALRERHSRRRRTVHFAKEALDRSATPSSQQKAKKKSGSFTHSHSTIDSCSTTFNSVRRSNLRMGWF